MSFEIQHSGLTFVSLGYTDRRRHIWPIEEYLVRRKHKPKVADRIRRLNPNGKEEGEMPRGIYLKTRPDLMMDVASWSRVAAKTGADRARKLFEQAATDGAIYKDGRRKYIRGLWFIQHV